MGGRHDGGAAWHVKALGLTTKDPRKAELARLRRAAKLERDIVKAARSLGQLRQKADAEIVALSGGPTPVEGV